MVDDALILQNWFGAVNLNACSLLTHDFVHADFGSGREPLDDCHLGVYFVGVLGSKFPSPTLSVSVEGGIPAKEDLTMATVGSVVGSHFLSFFLSYLSTFYQIFLSLSTPKKDFFCDFFGTVFALEDFPAFGTPFAS